MAQQHEARMDLGSVGIASRKEGQCRRALSMDANEGPQHMEETEPRTRPNEGEGARIERPERAAPGAEDDDNVLDLSLLGLPRMRRRSSVGQDPAKMLFGPADHGELEQWIGDMLNGVCKKPKPTSTPSSFESVPRT